MSERVEIERWIKSRMFQLKLGIIFPFYGWWHLKGRNYVSIRNTKHRAWLVDRWRTDKRIRWFLFKQRVKRKLGIKLYK